MKIFDILKRQHNENTAAQAVLNQTADYWMTPTQWKELLDEVLSPILARELGLQYLGNYIWAGAWDNHRRKVVRVFLMNQSGGTLQWGWCFDFVPHLSGENIVYRRTDKSIGVHIWELPEGFISGEPGSFKRMSTIILSYGSNRELITDAYKKTVIHLLPDIKAYFMKTENAENMLIEVKNKSNNNYYQFTDGLQLGICGAFLSAAMGYKEQGKTILSALEFREDYTEIEQKLIERLEQQAPIYTS